MEVLTYDPEFVRSLESHYTEGVHDSIKQKLLHLKQKNSFNAYPVQESKQSVFGTKKAHPQESQHAREGETGEKGEGAGEEWREAPQVTKPRPRIGASVNPRTKECGLLLNKLSESNFDSIFSQIQRLIGECDEAGESITEFLIERLFQSAMIQVNFCGLYAKICRGLMERNTGLQVLLLQKIATQQSGIREHRAMVPEQDYDEFCSSVAWKNRHIGCYQFITELYNHDTVPLEKLTETLEDIMALMEAETQPSKTEILVDSLRRIHATIRDHKEVVTKCIKRVLGELRSHLNFRSIFILEDVVKSKD